MLLTFYVLRFLSSVDSSCYYYRFLGLFPFCIFRSSLQTFTTQVAACYCCIFLPVHYLLHKWQPVTAVYSSQCTIYYTSGNLLLLYIPPSALFTTQVAACYCYIFLPVHYLLSSHYKPNSNKQGTRTTTMHHCHCC